VPVDPLDALAGAAAGAALAAFVATFGHGLRHPKQLLKRAQAEAAFRRLGDIEWGHVGRAQADWRLLVAAREQDRPPESPKLKEVLNEAFAWTRSTLNVATDGVRRLTAATEGASWATPTFRTALDEFHDSVEDLRRALGEEPEAAGATRILAALESLATRDQELRKAAGAILDLHHADE
jgi:hypothetical protein